GVMWFNTSNYRNAEVDRLLGRAAVELDTQKRIRLYREFQRIVTDELPVVWINVLSYHSVYNNRLDHPPLSIWGALSPLDEVYWKTPRYKTSKAIPTFEEALRDSEERYRAIFEQAADSIVVSDVETNAFLMFNQKAYQNLGYTAEEFDNLRISDFEIIESTDDVSSHIEKILKEGSDLFETKHRTKSGEIKDIRVNTRTISIQGKRYFQSIWRDMTDLKQAQVEREKLISEVQESLSRVKRLSGLLPICASCKKIRDDSGYWNQLESYIEEYSEAEFTHGLCEDCGDKLYGDQEWYKKHKAKGK
ncbi:MAG: PAS domain S-box protein, partial [Proteobacteria bacterium]|nr:PAS domain S-box protein [Pseudomonadota bacterium]